MRAVSSGTGGTGCGRRSDMDDLQTRDPSNAAALHKAADFANSVRPFEDRKLPTPGHIAAVHGPFPALGSIQNEAEHRASPLPYSGVRLTRRIAGFFEEVPAFVGAEQSADVAQGGPERLERARGRL